MTMTMTISDIVIGPWSRNVVEEPADERQVGQERRAGSERRELAGARRRALGEISVLR